MLTVLLGVLRILGIVLLVLLGLVLAVLLLILFFPITYRVKWNTYLRARFRWLFGFVHGGIDYPDPGILTVKVLWFTVLSMGGKGDKSEKEETPEEEKTPKEVEMSEGAETSEEVDTPPETDKTDDSADSTEQPEQAETADDAPRRGIAGFFEKIRYTISSICAKIKQIRTKEEYYREILTADSTREVVRHLWMRLGKLLRAIRPRHIKADLRFGTGSPDTTGYALAVYGMMSPRIGWAVNLTPDFEEKVLEGRAKLSGHIILAVVLWHLGAAALDKRLHRLIRQLKTDPEKQQTHKAHTETDQKKHKKRKRKKKKAGKKERKNGIKQRQ